jgi:hypothetical protein
MMETMISAPRDDQTGRGAAAEPSARDRRGVLPEAQQPGDDGAETDAPSGKVDPQAPRQHVQHEEAVDEHEGRPGEECDAQRPSYTRDAPRVLLAFEPPCNDVRSSRAGIRRGSLSTLRRRTERSLPSAGEGWEAVRDPILTMAASSV